MDLEVKETKYINTDGYTYTNSNPLDLEHYFGLSSNYSNDLFTIDIFP